MKKYRTPNGQLVEESVLRQKYGDKFDGMVSSGTFVAEQEPVQASGTFITPNGKTASEGDLRSRYGDKFDSLVNQGTFKKKDGTTASGNGTPDISPSNSISPSGLVPSPEFKKSVATAQNDIDGNGFSMTNFGVEDKTKVLSLPGNNKVKVDPRTIPVSLIKSQNNPEEYVYNLNLKMQKGETITPQEAAFIKNNQRPMSQFTVDDEIDLQNIATGNGVPLSVPEQTTALSPLSSIPSYGDMTKTPEGKYQLVQTLRGKLKEEIKAAENLRRSSDKFDAKEDPKIVAAKRQQLEELDLINKKLSRQLTKEGENAIEANVSTDESGNKWESFKDKLKDYLSLPSYILSDKNDHIKNKLSTLPKEFVTGMNYLKFQEPVQFERITKMLANGEAISESQIANVTHYGLDIEKERVKEKFESKGMDEAAYNEKMTDLDTRSYENLVGNKEASRAFFSSQIAEVLDERSKDSWLGRVGDTDAMKRRASNLGKAFGHKWDYSDQEIAWAAETVARANGIDTSDSRVKETIKWLQDNEGAMIMQNSISKAGWTRDFLKGAAQPIRGIVATLETPFKTEAEQYAEGQSQGNVNISEMPVKRLEKGWEGAVGKAFEGSGQLVTQIGLSAMLSGASAVAGRAILGRGGMAALAGDVAIADMGAANIAGRTLLNSKDGVATVITSFASTYDGYKKTAQNYTADEGKATTLAIGFAGLEGAVETILSPLDIARGVAKKLLNKEAIGKGIISIVDDVAVVNKWAAAKKLFTSTIGESAKVIGAEISEESLTQLADFGANAIFNPDSKTFQDRELGQELWNTAQQTGLSMAIPALISGGSAFSANSFSKGSLLVAAQNTQHFIDDMKSRMDRGEMEMDEYNAKVSMINTAQVVNEKLPLKADGTKLSLDEKADYIFSRVSEAVMGKKLAESDDKAEQDVIISKIANQQQFRKDILNNENNQAPVGQNAENQDAQNAVDAQAENTTQPENTSGLNEDDTVFIRETFEAGALPEPMRLSVTDSEGNLDETKLPQALQEIASQSQGIALDGTRVVEGGRNLVEDSGYPQALVDLANKQFPLEGVAKTKEAVDVIQPVMDRIGNTEPINEKELDDAQNILYEAIDANPDAQPLLEPLITKLQDYDNKTTTETRTVTESVPVEGAFAARSKRETTPFLETAQGKNVTVTLPDGSVRRGTFDIKGGQYAVDVPGGTQVVLGEKALTDLQIDLPTEQEMENPITFDEFGRPESITFKVSNGNLVTIEDPEIALNLAIRLKAEVLGDISDDRFEQAFQQVQREVQVEVPIPKTVKTETPEAAQKRLEVERDEKISEVKPELPALGFVEESVIPDTGVKRDQLRKGVKIGEETVSKDQLIKEQRELIEKEAELKKALECLTFKKSKIGKGGI